MNGELIDTNVLVYAYDITDEEKHLKSKEIIQKIWKDGNGITTVQNLTEFFVVVTRKIEFPLPITEAKIIVNDLLNSRKWIIFDRDVFTLSRAMEIVKEYNIHLWDALIAQVMLDNNINIILTENIKDFCKIPVLRSVNPFTN
jgi:predicted nucleic acid-binding protein